jgi:hypothetical protein
MASVKRPTQSELGYYLNLSEAEWLAVELWHLTYRLACPQLKFSRADALRLLWRADRGERVSRAILP